MCTQKVVCHFIVVFIKDKLSHLFEQIYVNYNILFVILYGPCNTRFVGTLFFLHAIWVSISTNALLCVCFPLAYRFVKFWILFIFRTSLSSINFLFQMNI